MRSVVWLSQRNGDVVKPGAMYHLIEFIATKLRGETHQSADIIASHAKVELERLGFNGVGAIKQHLTTLRFLGWAVIEAAAKELRGHPEDMFRATLKDMTDAQLDAVWKQAEVQKQMSAAGLQPHGPGLLRDLFKMTWKAPTKRSSNKSAHPPNGSAALPKKPRHDATTAAALESAAAVDRVEEVVGDSDVEGDSADRFAVLRQQVVDLSELLASTRKAVVSCQARIAALERKLEEKD